MYSFFCLCLLTIPYSLNFVKEKPFPSTPIKIEIDSTLLIDLATKQNKMFIDSIILKTFIMLNDKKQQEEKPPPPPTQIIKEGESPVKQK